MQAVEPILGREVFDDGDASRVGTYYNVICRTVSAHISQNILGIASVGGSTVHASSCAWPYFKESLNSLEAKTVGTYLCCCQPA